MSLHIVFFVPMWPVHQFPNGIGTYVYEMRAALIARGHRVSVLAGHLGSGCADDRVYAVPELGPMQRAMRRLRALWAGEDVEVFRYWRSIKRGLDAIDALESVDVFEIEESFGWGGSIQTNSKIPIVVRLHGPAVFTVLGPLRESRRTERRIALEGPLLKAARLVLSPCRATLQALQSHYRIELPSTRIVPNPIALTPDIHLWDSARSEPDTVLFVGRFDFGKGADLLLSAFESLLNLRPAARLLFVGPDDGLIDAEGVRRQFQEYCALNLKPETNARIEFFGMQTREQIELLRVRSRVTVMTSRWENQPYVLMEAMWQGCPIVANSSGGVPEVIEAGRTGLLADAHNALEFSRAIDALLGDVIHSQRLGEAARIAVAAEHGPSPVSALALQAYEWAAERRTPGVN